MKYKNILVFLTVFAVLGAIASYGLSAKAEYNESDSSAEIQQKQMELNREAEKKALEGASEATKKEAEIRWEAQKKQFENNRENAKNASSTDIEEGDDDNDEDWKDADEGAQEHRSEISNFVRSLLNMASTTSDKGIGEKVREVAKEQSDSKDKTAKAIDEVKGRNALITLLIGADFKNLGELRSYIVTTENHINKLSDIRNKVSPEMQVELDKEIATLNSEKERLSGIIKANESRISLFGWLFKMFQ